MRGFCIVSSAPLKPGLAVSRGSWTKTKAINGLQNLADLLFSCSLFVVKKHTVQSTGFFFFFILDRITMNFKGVPEHSKDINRGIETS